MSPSLLATLARIRWIESQVAPSTAARAEPPRRTGAAAAFRELVERTAQRYGVDPALVDAVIQAESGYDPQATSPAGAVGLMQLLPTTARGLGVLDPYDPVQNVEGGVRYLRSLLDRFGDVQLALAAYNAGPGAVLRYGGVPPYPETRTYVQRVLSTWGRARQGPLGGGW